MPLTFIVLQATSFAQVFVAVLFLIIFCSLLIYKFPQYWHLIAIFLGVVITLCFINQRINELKIGEPIRIYSDQVKVSDNFFYGEGKLEKNKVLISGTANKSFEKELNKYHAIYLVNYKAKVETIMPATNPGEFDYQKYYRSKKIRKRVKLESYQIYPRQITIFDWVHMLRKFLMD